MVSDRPVEGRPPVHYGEAPSEEFMRAMCLTGSAIVECEFCGRVHFAAGTALEHDRDRMEEVAGDGARDPDKYVEHSGESVLWGIIEGKQAVMGCRCNAGTRYERFVWEHRRQIGDYYRARVEKMKSEVADESRVLEGFDAAAKV